MVHSYSITDRQRNIILPIYGMQGQKRLLTRVINGCAFHYFIGTHSEYLELLKRCVQ